MSLVFLNPNYEHLAGFLSSRVAHAILFWRQFEKKLKFKKFLSLKKTAFHPKQICRLLTHTKLGKKDL